MAHLWVERVMTTLFGCSGPNAMSIITRNVECAALQAQLVTAILCLSLFAYLYGGRRGWFFPAIVCGMLAAHPLWILDPYRGDCGVALVQSAQSLLNSHGFWLARREPEELMHTRRTG